MGFQLGPSFLRKPPKGWVPAHAFALKFSRWTPTDVDGGGSEIDTVAVMRVLWRVEAAGREPWEVSEEDRSAPTWILDSPLGSGKRWYKVRVRPQYGLMRDVPIPCFVDPSDPGNLWIDWDGAYDVHVEAWERESRIRRAKAEREGGLEGMVGRISNPFAGKLREGEDELVDATLAREAARMEEQRAVSAEREREELARRGIEPVADEDQAEQARRIRESERLHASGRKVDATVVCVTDSGRRIANMPVLMMEFDLEDEGGVRRVRYEHIWGPRHAKRYKPGKRIKVSIDPDDPGTVELAS